MKRLTAFLLAAVLLLALVPFAGAAFTDESEIAEGHRKAVAFVQEKGVISGFPDGSFKPKEQLTRAQAAKILCVTLEGADKAEALTKTDTGFSDVPASHWAAKFVAYCAEKNIVAGVGDGKFSPDAALTTAAFAKMLVAAYGYAKAEELIGAAWEENTRKALQTYGFDRGAGKIGDLPATREVACQLAYNVIAFAEIMAFEPEAYKETTIEFKDPGSYRLLGRALQTDKGVVCDWSADGVEFTLNCKGTISLTVSESGSPSTTLQFRVFVDGEMGEQTAFAKGESTAAAFWNVTPGEHTIRIIKDTAIMSTTEMLISVTTYAKDGTMKPTAPKAKRLTCIGDSIACGYGILPTENMKSTKNTASAALTFGYRVAETLGMDYELAVKGSLGFVVKAGTPKYNMLDLYEYQNRYRDAEKTYDFPVKSDLILLPLGVNDGLRKEELETAVRAFIATLRRIHGENVPIVLMYDLMNPRIEWLYQKLGAELPNTYVLKMTENRKGAANHPNLPGHDQFTKETLELIREKNLA